MTTSAVNGNVCDSPPTPQTGRGQLQSATRRVLCPPVRQAPGHNDKERHARVVRLFDAVAPYYDRMNRIMSCGTGDWYRRSALRRAGLTECMRLLDVGCGTGIVAGQAAHIVGPLGGVMALDPSMPMLRTTRQHRVPGVIQGIGEFLPFADQSFDMLSMGYALRHVTDLHVTFGEYHRVLKPGGVVLLLEIAPATRRLSYLLLKWYLKFLMPAVTVLCTRNREAQVLMAYYWETIERCVAPQTIMAALEYAGFTQTHRHVMLGIFSAYTAKKR